MNKPLSVLLRVGLSLGLALPLLAPVATRAGEKAEWHGSCGKIVMKAKKMAGAPTVNLRLRDGACLDGTKVMKVLPAGTSVTILGEADGWYKVSYDGMTGWMSAEYVEASGAATEKKEKQTATVTKDAVLGKRSMVGISEADFAKVEAKRVELLNRLKDKVLLRVQKKGETWYVEKDGSLTRVKMYGKNEFKRVSSDLKEEKKKSEKSEKKQAELPPAGSISLKAEAAGNKVKLVWVANVEAPNGFKVVKSLEPNPVYPGDSAEYVDASTRSRELWLDGGKTYHFRVCRYTGSGCDSYSNDVEVTTTGDEQKTSAKYELIKDELVLKAVPLPGAVALEWTKCTSEGFGGYKVVRSEKNADPSYPADGYVEFLPDRSSLYFIDGTAVPGKAYYYRVCALEHDGPVACGNVVKAVAK